MVSGTTLGCGMLDGATCIGGHGGGAGGDGGVQTGSPSRRLSICSLMFIFVTEMVPSSITSPSCAVRDKRYSPPLIASAAVVGIVLSFTNQLRPVAASMLL